MTPEQFRERAQAEVAYRQMTQGQPVDVDGLRGCLMVAVQMAQSMGLPLADLQSLVSEEHSQWMEYVKTKERVIARRKEQKK